MLSLEAFWLCPISLVAINVASTLIIEPDLIIADNIVGNASLYHFNLGLS